MTPMRLVLIPMIAIFGIVLPLPPTLGAQASSSVLDEVSFEQFLEPMDVPRLALVIGAEHYENYPSVPNALNDARGIASKLVSRGFTFVRFVQDPKDYEVYDYIKELVQRAGDETDRPIIVLFYYAGHGFHDKDDNTNYIVPVNAAKPAKNISVPITSLLYPLATHQKGLAIFVFDSCRNVLRSEGKGFADQVPVEGAVIDMAAAYDQTASSGVTEGAVDSPFTQAFLYFIDQEGMPLPTMFGKISTEVDRMTQQAQLPKQVPEMVALGNTGYGFYFNPSEQVLTDELNYWKAALKTGKVTCVKNYAAAHPGSKYLTDAVQWLSDPNHIDTRDYVIGSCPD
jgi:hypothetical protein